MAISLNDIKNNDTVSSIKQKTNAQELADTKKAQSIQAYQNETSNQQRGTNLIYKRYTYTIESFDIIHPAITQDLGKVDEPGVLKLLTDSITNITLTKSEDEMLTPVFKIQMTIPPTVKEFIMNNKQGLKFRLRMQCSYSYGNDEITTGANAANDVINAIFVTYTQDESDFSDMPLFKQNVEMQGLGDAAANLSAYTDQYELFLWKEGHVEALRKIVNNVYSNTDIMSVLVQCFNEYGIDSLLISPPDNKTQYSQIMIPPLNLMNLPKFIDENYGLYYRGTTFFYDFRCLYVLNRNGICDAYEEGEYKRTIITIAHSGTADTKRTGVADDPNAGQYYIFADGNNIHISNPSKTNDVINGGNMYIIDSRNGSTVDLSNASDPNGNYRLIEDKFGNSFNKGQYASNILEENLKVTIAFDDYDMNIFTPNKEFVFNFMDSNKYKYSGTYRLYSEKIALVRRGKQLHISGVYSFTWKRGMDEAERISLTESVYGPNINTEKSTDPTGASKAPTPLGDTSKFTSNPDVTVPFDCNVDSAFTAKKNDITSKVTDFKKPSLPPVPLAEKAKGALSTQKSKLKR